jgi:beta-lactamase superfamily II metal-dependent hydrolase
MPNGIAFQFLDVGMGDCTLVEMPPWDGGDLWLVDFGERGSPFKVAARDAMAFLVNQITLTCKQRKLQAPRIDYLFLTHSDLDHWNKLDWLIEGKTDIKTDLWKDAGWPQGTTCRIGKVVYGGQWSDYSDKNATLAQLIKSTAGAMTSLANKDHDEPDNKGKVAPRWHYEQRNEDLEVKVYLLGSNHPTKTASDPNPKSIVLMFEYQDYKVILTGDAEGHVAEPAIIKNYRDAPGFLRCHALKLGHHGSAAASSEAWLKATKPAMVFATGDKRWGHPYCEAITRAQDAGGLTTGMARWFSCAMTGSGADNDYRSTNTRTNVCTNLWYVVTQKPNVTLPGPDGKNYTEAVGMYLGVQYRLQINPDGGPLLTVTPQWPRA